MKKVLYPKLNNLPKLKLSSHSKTPRLPNISMNFQSYANSLSPSPARNYLHSYLKERVP